MVIYAFIIDHALREGSAKEAKQAAEFAKSYGYDVRIIRWEHNGISSGIQAKARAFRYEALGRLCRETGIIHLLTAHTEDDQAETLLMRSDRETGWRGLAGMPKKAYAPLWPALAGVTLHRPWLDKSRESARRYNERYGLSFIDDPSNENTDFARIRARQTLAADPELRADLLSKQSDMQLRLEEERRAHGAWLKTHAKLFRHGYIETDAVPPAELLRHILNAVSGRGGPIDAAKRARLCGEMESPDFKAATLGGAWVLRKKTENHGTKSHSFLFLRDRDAVTGRSDRNNIQRVALEMNKQMLWDGRFICHAKMEGIHIETGFGNLQKLRQLPEFKHLFYLPKEVRESVPVFYLGEKPVGYGNCDSKFLRSRATSASRLQAMFGETLPVSV